MYAQLTEPPMCERGVLITKQVKEENRINTCKRLYLTAFSNSLVWFLRYHQKLHCH